jgi:hypothetical protein
MWTGDSFLASNAAPVLRLYSIGNALLALAAFPFYLQYAKGNLKYHVYSNAIFICIFILRFIWGLTRAK